MQAQAPQHGPSDRAGCLRPQGFWPVFRRYLIWISSGTVILKADIRGHSSWSSGPFISRYSRLRQREACYFNDTVTWYNSIASVIDDKMNERTNEYGGLMKWHCGGKTEVPREKHVTVPFFTSTITYTLNTRLLNPYLAGNRLPAETCEMIKHLLTLSMEKLR
jgi:hypothetical protein